jgi:3-oxo-5-alpha-steroid 4-dehydrogenase 1
MNFTADPTFNLALTVAFAIVALTLVAAPFIASPYGRFATDRFGMSLDPRVGWFLMELPATLAVLLGVPAQP